MKSKILSIAFIFLASIFSSQAQTLTADVKHSEVKWKGTKKVGEHYGTINLKSGNIIMTNGKIAGGEFIIDMKGINIKDTDDEGDKKDIIKDISSKQFFNIAQFPTTKFVITGYENGELIGNLTIKGITNKVKFKTTYKLENNKVVANTISFTIDRQKWELKFGNWLKENVLDDPIHFEVHIETL